MKKLVSKVLEWIRKLIAQPSTPPSSMRIKDLISKLSKLDQNKLVYVGLRLNIPTLAKAHPTETALEMAQFLKVIEEDRFIVILKDG